MRPTRKAGVVGLLAGLLFVSGSTAQAGWLFVLASAILGALVFSLVSRHRLRYLQVERTAPARVQVGDEAQLSLAVTNTGSRPSPITRLTDRFEGFGEVPYLVESIPPGETVLLTPKLPAMRRGVFDSGQIEVRTGTPFGLKRSRNQIEVPGKVTIVPRWVMLRSFPLLEPASFPRERLHERARVGSSDELFGTREYRRGDPFRSIHWKSSAHAGHLIVREYQQEVAGRVVLAVWARESGTAPDSDLETLVSSAASIGIYALHAGHRVDVCYPSVDGPVVTPALDRNSLLDALAAAGPAHGDPELFIQQVIRRSGKRSTVVFHTSTAEALDLDLGNTLRRIEHAGNRVITVNARSSSWLPGCDEVPVEEMMTRSRVSRVVTKDKDLRSCLEDS